MAMDFPNSPAINDTYSVGNQIWKWTGVSWDLVALAGPTGPTGPIGATGPTGPTGPTGATGSTGIVSVSTAAASGALTLTTVQTDITGATLTVAMTTGQKAIVNGVIDFNVTGSGVGACTGYLVVAGVSQSAQNIWNPATTGRSTVSQAWVYTAASSTNFVFKLQAKKAINAGTATAETQHTTITVQVV